MTSISKIESFHFPECFSQLEFLGDVAELAGASVEAKLVLGQLLEGQDVFFKNRLIVYNRGHLH